MIVVAYAASLLVIERLFRIVKPKLLMLNWFATTWELVVKARRLIGSWLGVSLEPESAVTVPVTFNPTEMPRAKVSRD
jgi:hypothetical protein